MKKKRGRGEGKKPKKIKKKLGKNGGKRKGAGKKPIKAHITNYHETLRLLDEAAPEAVKTLTASLKSKNEMIRVKAATAILKKIVADKKEISGADGGPIEVRVITQDAKPDSEDIVPQDAEGSVSIAGAV